MQISANKPRKSIYREKEVRKNNNESVKRGSGGNVESWEIFLSHDKGTSTSRSQNPRNKKHRNRYNVRVNKSL